MFEHNLIKATVIPDIDRIVSKYYDITEKEALKRYYQSKTAANYDDEETGLYGQSALFIAGLFIMEQDGSVDLSRIP